RGQARVSGALRRVVRQLVTTPTLARWWAEAGPRQLVTAPTFAKWWASTVALRALVRRDLTGTRRGPAVTWARVLAILVSSASALVALALVDAGPGTAQVGTVASTFLMGGLSSIAMLLAPAIAVTALSREREAG